MNKFFTSESVTEGHPDKMADQISDAILDAILTQDKDARVACETFITNTNIYIGGEITTTANIDYEQITRDTIKKIGYTKDEYGVTNLSYKITINIIEQSKDINKGVDLKNGEIGAGDQGIMFGYACDETTNLMPFAIDYAHLLAKRLTEVRKEKIITYLRPDGKVQITVEYDNNNIPFRVDAIVVSTQHNEGIDQELLKKDIKKNVIKPIIPKHFIDDNTKYFINPTGNFVIGGSIGDAGLTGRKIIVDTYGGSAAHGGGAFSGKDYTKVDRSAAYMARYLAKNIVAAKLASKVQLQLSYAIGITEPISIHIETFGTSKIEEQVIIKAINENFSLSPSGIIKFLELDNPIYQATASYGHFGNEEYNWEKTNSINIFTKLLK